GFPFGAPVQLPCREPFPFAPVRHDSPTGTKRPRQSKLVGLGSARSKAIRRERHSYFAMAQLMAPREPGCYLGWGLSFAVWVAGPDLQAAVAVAVVVVANHASFFPNRAHGLTSSFQARCVAVKVCF